MHMSSVAACAVPEQCTSGVHPALPACRASAAALPPLLLTVMSHTRASAAWWAVWYGSPGSTSTLASAYDRWITSRMLLAIRKAASLPSMPGLDTTPAASWLACQALLEVFWMTASAAHSSRHTTAAPVSTQHGDSVRSQPSPMIGSVPSTPHQAAAMLAAAARLEQCLHDQTNTLV